MGRKSLKEGRRKEIIQAFYEVAIIEGLENTSLSKIAKHIDMPTSLLVHYFKNKEELLEELTEYIVNHYKLIYTSEADTTSNPLDRLTGVINNIFSRKWNTYFDDGVFYSYYALIFRNEAIRKKYYSMHQLLREWLAEIIQECIDANLVDLKDAMKASEFIFVLSDGAYYYLSMVDDDKLYRKKLDFYREQALESLAIKSPND